MDLKQVSIIVLFLAFGCSTGQEFRQIGTFQAEDARFWEVVPRDARAENIGIEFNRTEGPAWHPDGSLIFSDIPANKIYRWNGKRYVDFRNPSNHSNGLLVDADGSVLACEHGSRSLTRYSNDGEITVLAESYMEKRLNSPNDLCMASSGAIYFTDPPLGLPGRNGDPGKELPFNGVFRLFNGELTLVDSTLSLPNGIALSPDDRFLYVANLEIKTKEGNRVREVFWMRYELDDSGKVKNKQVFFRAPDPSLPGGPDGMKVDRNGNLFMTGPGGILVVDQAGKLLGTIGIPIPATNLTFDKKEKNLYITARTNIVRITLH